MKFTISPSTDVLIIDKDKILLSRRKNTGWEDGNLCIPGGHVEKDETPRQAAVRELKEELDIDVKVDDLEFVCVVARNKEPTGYVDYEFTLSAKGLKHRNAEPDRCSELIWVDINNLPDDVIHVSRDVIEKGLIAGIKYLETNY